MSDQLEEMATCFDVRAAGYEEHMRACLDVPAFYGTVAAAIAPTEVPIRILDLGVGTGLELAGIFARAPRAHITCLDLSTGMLDLLRQNHADRLAQLTILQQSYMTWPFPEQAFQYVVSVQTLHHFLPEAKVRLYRRIMAALAPGGIYAEGDYIAPQPDEERLRAEYLAREDRGDEGHYHIDLPCSIRTQVSLLREAGFARVEVTYQAINCAVFVCAKV